ncbi:MAG: hypothetical protein KAG64_04850 [Bacteroidales bacterium]|nr:hypothetical protein [Bacteroidales bacterium]
MIDRIIYRFLFLLVILLVTTSLLSAQEKDFIGQNETFGATRISLTQSVEPTIKGQLVLDIQHQFGPINSGIQEFFGLDQATTRLGLTYGVFDWLSIGVGRTGLYKTYDGSVKARIFRQNKDGGMPLTLSYFGNVGIYTTPWNYDNVPYDISHRLSYVNQLLIARRFGDHLSVQISPTFIHRNFVESREADNDVWNMGMAVRYLFAEKYSVTVDYHYLLSKYTADNYNNSLTIGFNILTAGHVFSLFASNSLGLVEQQFIPMTKGSWLDGDIHFGFTISRSFTIVEPDYF